MKTLQFKTNEEWMEGRLGRIGGSRLGKVFSKRDKKPLKAFWEVVAERVALPVPDENVMDRGHRLEEEALKRFEEETGKKTERNLVIWHRDENDYIAVSPDGTVVGEPAACEVKCLNSASHIEAWVTKEVPGEYEEQGLQYFIVNDELQTLYFCFYDPRMPKDFFYITIKREDVADKIAEFLALQQQATAQMEDIISQLTF
jgi:predicted phage-related endonuclease